MNGLNEDPVQFEFADEFHGPGESKCGYKSLSVTLIGISQGIFPTAEGALFVAPEIERASILESERFQKREKFPLLIRHQEWNMTHGGITVVSTEGQRCGNIVVEQPDTQYMVDPGLYPVFGFAESLP